jgi:hypothetical protein
MDETKPHVLGYSRESIDTTTFDSPPRPPRTAQSSATEPGPPFPEPTPKTGLSQLPEFASNLRHISLAELTAFLKRTRHLWLTAAGVVFGLIVLVSLVHRVVEWARKARERRHELAVATVDPDRLIARCGEAVQDVTKEVFPIFMRTMSYPASGNRTLVLAFSRTAEEKSDWVFLSMHEETGSSSYETPDAKIAALPCLDSTK